MSSVDLPQGLVHDIRMPIAGDSFQWDGVEPTAAKKSLVFHHSASDAPAEDGFSIANYHVTHNGWGGIGYHIVITRSDYPGKPEYNLPAGAHIQYVGDLGTWRAHVLNQNPGRVGICLVGMTPDNDQLRLARSLVDFLIAPNNILPSINYYNQVTVHRLVPDQSTSCPGDDYNNWLPYLQGGAEPASFAPPVEPPPVPVEVPPVDDRPEWQITWVPLPVTTTMMVAIESFAVDATGANSPIHIPAGTTVAVAGQFNDAGRVYYRTQYSVDHGTWYGVDASTFATVVPVTGSTPPADIPVTVTTNDASLPQPQIKTGVISITKIIAIVLWPFLKLYKLLRGNR